MDAFKKYLHNQYRVEKNNYRRLGYTPERYPFVVIHWTNGVESIYAEVSAWCKTREDAEERMKEIIDDRLRHAGLT